MTKAAKIRSGAESLSVSEAAAALGISTPTLKRMVAEDRLDSFRTPGGHLRITMESIKDMREQRHARPRPMREASPVLQNRRERLEELTLEAQEHRARRELEKLRREEQEEAETLEAEAQAREDEAAERQAELEVERERLELEKAQEEARQEHERAQERQKLQAAREATAFRCRWAEKASEAVTAYQYRWLSATQRKEMLDGLEAEIAKRQPADDPRMGAIIVRTLEALVEPLRAARDTQERRQRLTEDALRSLHFMATEPDKVQAAVAIREALRRFDDSTGVYEMRVAAQEAVRPISQAIARRMLDARLINWAISELPWGRTDRDKARITRECTEILTELPIDLSEVEGKEALEPTVNEARHEIEERRAEEQRKAQKASLIQQGVAEILSYLLELKRADEISADDYRTALSDTQLSEAVRSGLEAEVSGKETAQEVQDITHELIDQELGRE